MATTSSTATPSANGHTAKGLRKGQIRILAFLAKVGTDQPRKVIAEKAPVDQANCVELIGSTKDDIRLANDEKHYPSLVTLKLVKPQADEEFGTTYVITPAGRKALEKANKEANAKAGAK